MRFRRHLVLTEQGIIKGHLKTEGRRLSTFLNNTVRPFLEMEESSLVSSTRGQDASPHSMLLNRNEILLAHEMEETGDDGLRQLAELLRDEVAVTAHFSGVVELQVTGNVGKRAMDRCASGQQVFIVLAEPRFRCPAGEASEQCSILEGLPYVILNTRRLNFLSVKAREEEAGRSFREPLQ